MRILCVGFWCNEPIAICIADRIYLPSLCVTGLYQVSGSTTFPVAYVVPCVRFDCIVRYFCLLYNCNTWYEWLVRPYSTGTFTLQETPNFAWRTITTYLAVLMILAATKTYFIRRSLYVVCILKYCFNMIHFYFIGGFMIKHQIIIDQFKNPVVLCFSSRRNKPALDVRFLAAKSILLN
jgi:hypothetical protein